MVWNLRFFRHFTTLVSFEPITRDIPLWPSMTFWYQWRNVPGLLDATMQCSLRPVYSDTTQLNSTSSWVKLRRRNVYSDTTQLNSLDWPASRWLAVRYNWVSCTADRRRQLSCVGEGVYSDATQLNSIQLTSTRRRVELSCFAKNGPLINVKKLLFL